MLYFLTTLELAFFRNRRHRKNNQITNRQKHTTMTRGNQREIDRQRAAARHAGKGESKDGDFLQRKVVQSERKLENLVTLTPCFN